MTFRAFAFTAALAAALACSAPGAAHAQGVDLVGVDRSVVPGDDFFAYANGGWAKVTEIPADRSSWGGNAILAETVDKDVVALIRGLSSGAPQPGSEAARVADYYAAFMDETGIEAKGVAPLQPVLATIPRSATIRACRPTLARSCAPTSTL